MGVGKVRWHQETIIDGDDGVISLTHDDGREQIHYFDADLYGQVSQYKWTPFEGYLLTNPTGLTNVRLHWLVLGRTTRFPGQEVDHIDNDRSNSRRANLRVVSKRENTLNKITQSPYGYNIYKHHYKGYLVRVVVQGAKLPYQPVFRDLDKAQACRDLYVEIAVQIDSQTITRPTKEELKAIADSIRRQ